MISIQSILLCILSVIYLDVIFCSLPKDDLPLAIVESKYAAIVNGVSDKDDFFIHTPKKTIAQMKETKQVRYRNYNFLIFATT